MPINYKRYPENWKRDIVPAILIRDGNKCKTCGALNGGIVYVGLVCGDKEWFATYEEALKMCGPGIRRKGNKIIEFPRAVKVCLAIAHLDHDEQNHLVSLDRLAALCQMCHHKYDALEKVRRRKL